jgi:hypothetical protein
MTHQYEKMEKAPPTKPPIGKPPLAKPPLAKPLIGKPPIAELPSKRPLLSKRRRECVSDTEVRSTRSKELKASFESLESAYKALGKRYKELDNKQMLTESELIDAKARLKEAEEARLKEAEKAARSEKARSDREQAMELMHRVNNKQNELLDAVHNLRACETVKHEYEICLMKKLADGSKPDKIEIARLNLDGADRDVNTMINIVNRLKSEELELRVEYYEKLGKV